MWENDLFFIDDLKNCVTSSIQPKHSHHMQQCQMSCRLIFTFLSIHSIVSVSVRQEGAQYDIYQYLNSSKSSTKEFIFVTCEDTCTLLLPHIHKLWWLISFVLVKIILIRKKRYIRTNLFKVRYQSSSSDSFVYGIFLKGNSL